MVGLFGEGLNPSEIKGKPAESRGSARIALT